MVGVTLHKNYINPSAEHQESSNFICDLRALMCTCRTGPSAAVRKDWGKPLALKGEGIVHFCPSVSPFPVLSPFLSSYLHSFILSPFIPTFSVFPFTSLGFLLSLCHSLFFPLSPAALSPFIQGWWSWGEAVWDCVAELISGCWGKGSSVSCKNTVPLVAWQKGFAKIKGLFKAGR